jgi:hypothetical protein
MRLSKKARQQIELVSVADAVLRANYTCSYNHELKCFVDDAPDWWDDRDKEIFDLAYEIEDKLKKAILLKLASEAEELCSFCGKGKWDGIHHDGCDDCHPFNSEKTK